MNSVCVGLTIVVTLMIAVKFQEAAFASGVVAALIIGLLNSRFGHRS